MGECKVVKVIPCPPERKKKKKRKLKKKRGISSRARFRRLRRQIAGIRNEERRRFEELTAAISKLADTIAQLTAFTNQIRNDVNELQAQFRGTQTAPIIRQVLLPRINTSIVVETNAGAISGTLIEVGTDYIEILEPTGSIVLIPLAEVNSFV